VKRQDPERQLPDVIRRQEHEWVFGELHYRACRRRHERPLHGAPGPVSDGIRALTDLATTYPLLFRKRWTAGDLANEIPDATQVCREYRALEQAWRLEEHTAVALFGLRHQWPLPSGGSFRLLDYQTPLKTRRSDKGVGKIDLLGLDDADRLLILELKVIGERGGRSDAPPAALMEALRYTAKVEADFQAIRTEVAEKYGRPVSDAPPGILLLAPQSWWDAWTRIPTNWRPRFERLITGVEAELGVPIQCLALDDVELIYGLGGQPPTLVRVPEIRRVTLLTAAVTHPSPRAGPV
jgi:hypothetical protein